VPSPYYAVMGPFYVFHATLMHRARIHAGDCKYCRHGEGMENQHKTGSGATGWDGPFSALSDADARMASFRFSDTGRCQYCLGDA
jgi:F-type H+/Na+-transporting ATPase subunit beta